ncbi:hypothetical protein [Saccharothrix sp. ST-888]|nr:hypothetical protein [Saccharothrix sp. ST-888]
MPELRSTPDQPLPRLATAKLPTARLATSTAAAVIGTAIRPI